MVSLEILNNRIEKANSVQQDYKSLYEAAYELALPQRNMWTTRNQGQSKMEKVYDSAGITGVNGFVNRMQSSLTPPFTKWAKLITGPMYPEEQKHEADIVLEKVTDVVFSTLNASNFPIAVGEMYYDLVVGTGAMLILENNDIQKPIKFISVSTSELALDEGVEGEIAGIFRKHNVVAREILNTWPDAKINKDLADIISDDPHQKVEFQEATIFNSDENKWDYYVIYKQKHQLVKRQFETNPWVIVRWSKIAGEVFGRGPLLQALPDLKMLNKGKEMTIRSAMLNIFGVYTAIDDGVTNLNNIKLQPNAIIPVARNAGPNGPSIKALERTGDLNAQNFMFEELRQQINILLLNNRLPPDAGAVRSATEIIERMKELQVDIGAAFGRLIFEFIQPLLQRVISILENKGLIALGGGIKIDNLFTSVQILSPISKQEGLSEAETILQAVQLIQQVDPTGQLIQLTFDTEKLGKKISEHLGISPSILRTDEEKENLKQQAAQLINEQQQQNEQTG